MLTLLIVIIVIALLFDLVNGFHEAANSIATVIDIIARKCGRDQARRALSITRVG